MTSAPAEILGLPCGTLATGSSADICIFNPELSWLLDAQSIRSNGLNTPFLGWEMKGRVTHTLLGGRMVHELEGSA